MQNKLLPCPFCGGNLKRIKGGYEHKPNQCIASSIIFGDAFVDKWNTRKPMERIVEQLEEEKMKWLLNYTTGEIMEMSDIIHAFAVIDYLLEGNLEVQY